MIESPMRRRRPSELISEPIIIRRVFRRGMRSVLLLLVFTFFILAFVIERVIIGLVLPPQFALSY